MLGISIEYCYYVSLLSKIVKPKVIIMGSNKNEELKRTASEITAAVNDFTVDQHAQAKLLKQVDKLQYLLEEPLDVVNRQWEMASYRALTIVIAALHLLTGVGV
ncbi:hypothetical protein ACMFMG_004294 [Clarireedia jacksonii]